MKTKFLIPLLLTASYASSIAATGFFGSHVDIFTTTVTTHHSEAFGPQTSFCCQNLGTISMPLDPPAVADAESSKSHFVLIPEPASVFLGIIGLALLLLRRK